MGTDYTSIFADNKLANWDEFKQLDSASMLETVRDVAFPFIKSYNKGTEFNKSVLDLAFIITKPSLLSEAVESVVLANPPFKGSIDADDQNENFTIASKKTELLFVDLITRVLDIGGRAGVIIPDGVLFGSSNAHKQLREHLIEKNELKAVISMPSGVFKPYAGVSTAVLVFVKGGKTEKVWFYDMTADGYSLDDKRNKIATNDIPDIIEKYRAKDAEGYQQTKKHFFIDVADIKANDYDLSINRYKEIEYIEVKYPPIREIVGEIEQLTVQISGDLIQLKQLLGE